MGHAGSCWVMLGLEPVLLLPGTLFFLACSTVSCSRLSCLKFRTQKWGWENRLIYSPLWKATAPGKALAAVLSPVGSLDIHRSWPLYWRLYSLWKLSQVAHKVGLDRGLSLSSNMGSRVTLSLKGRFSANALLDPSPARCRERGGAETNQAKKPEPQARASLHQQTEPVSQVSTSDVWRCHATAGHKEPWLISLLGPKRLRPLR